MSTERAVQTPIGAGNITTEEIKATMSRTEKKARAARILDRGITADRTMVENLPSNLHGEWVANDPLEIHRMKILGFQIDDKYAIKRALHSEGGDSMSIVGDAVFMITDKENKEVIDEVRYEQYIRMHGTRAQKAELNLAQDGVKEEKEFKAQVGAIDLPIIEESKITQARKDEITDALQKTGEKIDKK